jgi:hypothetical protein
MSTRKRKTTQEQSNGATGDGSGIKSGGPSLPLPSVTSAKLKARTLSWLWKDYIPFGALTLIVGPTSVGKTTFLAALAAQVTGGPKLGDGKKTLARNVLWLTLENDLVIDVREKLKAAGADLARIVHPGRDEAGEVQRRLAFPTDIGVLREYIRKEGAALVVVEPMDSFLFDGFDVNKTADVRQLLDALHQLAISEGVVIVFTRHFNKSRMGGVLDWVSGSAAWTQCPRVVLTLDYHEEIPDLRTLSNSKPGLVKRPPSYTFTLDDVGSAPRFHLLDQSDDNALSVDGKLDAVAEKRGNMEAQAFLRAELGNGAVKTADLLKRAEAFGFHRKTIQRARAKLDIGYENRGSVGAVEWYYTPPEEGFPEA